MSADDPKSLNARWIQAFNERDWEAEGAYRSAAYQAHMSGAPVPLDTAAWEAFMNAFTTAFPDAKITIEDAVGEGDTVACRWTITGTHQGDFQGVPPTGRPITMKGIDFSRVADGRIAEHWAQFDILTVMQQIGALPPTA
jgi:steroid delta-isomerase-like uncharacterized protein